MAEALWQGEERRAERRDRRDPARAGLPPQGTERRRGDRRRPLPRSRLEQAPSMIAAALLGAVVTLALGAPRPAASEVGEMASVRAAARAVESAGASAGLLEAARGLRDEAEALTSAEVALDASLVDVWLPRLAELEAMIGDPATPAAIRAELEATVAALARVGLR